jgi:NADH-quinone oxidoreductase subunit H
VIVFVALLALTFFGGKEEPKEATEAPVTEFDAFAGGYPVPPRGDQVLPEFATVVAGEDEWPSEERTSDVDDGKENG